MTIALGASYRVDAVTNSPKTPGESQISHQTAMNVDVINYTATSQPIQLPAYVPAISAEQAEAMNVDQAAELLTTLMSPNAVYVSSQIAQAAAALDNMLRIKALAFRLGSPYRDGYIFGVWSLAQLLGQPERGQALFDEAKLAQKTLWMPHHHYDLELAVLSARVLAAKGNEREARAMSQALHAKLIEEAQVNDEPLRLIGRGRLRFYLSNFGGTPRSFAQPLELAEQVLASFGTGDELPVRAYLGATLSLRRIDLLADATYAARRAKALSADLTGLVGEQLRASAASQLGLCLMSTGALLEAQPLLEFARDESYRTRPTDDPSRAWAWYSTGMLYIRMGEFNRGIAQYERAIEIISERPKPLDDPNRWEFDRKIVRLWIGYAHLLAGRVNQGLSLFDTQMATEAMWHSNDPWIHATYATYATALIKRKRPEVAKRLLELGLRESILSGGPEHATSASIYAALAQLNQANPSLARDNLTAGLTTALGGSDSYSRVGIWFGLGEKLATKPTQQNAAIFAYKMGANEVSRLRERMAQGRDLIDAPIGSYTGSLKELTNLLVLQSRLPEAELAHRQFLEEEYLDFVRRSPRPARGFASPHRQRSETFGVPATELPMLGRETVLHRQVSKASAEALRHEKVLKQFVATTFNRDAALSGRSAESDSLKTSRAVAETESKQFLNSLEDFTDSEKKLNRDRLRRDGLAPSPLPHGISVRVRYAIFADKTVVFIQTATGLKKVTLPAGGSSVSQASHEFRQVLRRPDQDARPAAQALWTMLIAPVWSALKLHIRTPQSRIQFEPEDALRYVPFAALHDGKKYLIQYAVVIQAETQLVEPAMRESNVQNYKKHHGALPTIQLLAAAQSDDPSQLPLPHADAEIAALARQWHGSARSNATVADMLDAIAKKPSVLHVAAHFRFRPGSEADSELMLTDGRVSVAKLREQDFSGIDLITLAACDTSLSASVGKGSEIDGLTRTLLRGGANSVLGSLWQVADEATSQWMIRFYKTWQLGLGSTSKVDAAARTQRAFIAASGNANVNPSRSWAHPYFWAPFVLAGNWR